MSLLVAGPEKGPLLVAMLPSRHGAGCLEVACQPAGWVNSSCCACRGFVARVNGYNSGVEFRFIDACNREHDFSTQKCLK